MQVAFRDSWIKSKASFKTRLGSKKLKKKRNSELTEVLKTINKC